MGALPAPPWVTIFLVIHKEAGITQFVYMLQLYCSFINDVLGIWLFNPDPSKYHQLIQDYYGLE